MFQPRSYQAKAIDFICKQPRCAIWAACGMGKTSITLAALARLGKPKALIIAPLRVANSSWPSECQKWPDLGLSYSVVTGTPKQREAALRATADVFCTNYENLPWLIDALAGEWPFDVVVADEATKLKGYRSRRKDGRAAALATMAWQASRFIELTGTPSPNGLTDLWGQLWFLDKGQRLGKSFTAYGQEFFDAKQVSRENPWAIKYEPRPDSNDRIMSLLKDITLTLRPEDYFDLPQQVEVPILCDLPTEARREYNRMKKDLYIELDGQPITAANAAVKSAKLLQIASGAVYKEDGTWSYLHEAKLQALDSIIEELNEPLIVAYHWQSDLEALKARYPEGVTLDKNPATVKRWNAGQIKLLFLNPASAGHGLSLQDGGRAMVIFSPWWDLEQYLQVVERIGPTRQMQSGHPRTVFIYQLVAKTTMDGFVYERLYTKKSTQECLMEGLK